MSAGLAFPTMDFVAPAVSFPPPPPLEAQALPHTGMVHGHGIVGHASGHVADAAGHAVHEAADAALQVLGSLSGVLLAGRAAMVTTRLLAAAAVRAAGEQRCLERQQALAATAAEQWEAAAFAAVRINARRHALLARATRAGAAAGGPAGAPPHPDLPPPLEPVGARLCDLRQELTRVEEAVHRAEERHAEWEQKRLAAAVRVPEGDDGFQRALRESRRQALRKFADERTASAEGRQVPRQSTGPRGDPCPDAEEVRRTGAHVLGELDPYAAAGTAGLAAAAVEHAVRRAAGDPRRARIHLNEARKFVRDANRDARRTREAEERAAQHHAFLAYETPEGAEDIDPAPDALALLRRVLDEGVPLSPAERDLVERRVEERRCALEALYVREQCTGAVARLAQRFGGRATAGRPEGQEISLDWTPEGWEPGHWLRAALVDGDLRVATMYQAAPGERTPEQRALDDTRCHEAREHLARFEEITGTLGLGLEFTLEQTEGALPGVLGKDAWKLDDVLQDLVAEDAGRRPEPERDRDATREGSRHRTVDGDRRR